jgi:hypothetical protein
MTPHKHAALIIAWAAGAEIEVKTGKEWGTAYPAWSEESEYRLKPAKKYARIAELDLGSLVLCTFEKSEERTEANHNFKRWITDRIYYE